MAAWRALWTSTLRRGPTGRGRPTGRARRAGRSTPRRSSPSRSEMPCAAASASDVGAERRAEELLEPIGRRARWPAAGTRRSRRRRCRRRRSRRSTSRGRQRRGGVGVVHEGESPISTTVGAPVERSTERGRHDAVDAVGATIGVGAGAVRPPNHSRSRIGIEEATVNSASAGRWVAIVRATDRLGELGRRVAARLVDRALRDRLRGEPTGEPRWVRGPGFAAASTSSIEPTAVTLRSGSITPGPPTWTIGAPTLALHWASTLKLAGRPIRTITSGVWAAANVSAWRSSASSRTPPRRAVRASPRSGRRGSAIRSARATRRPSSRSTPLRPPTRITPRSRTQVGNRPDPVRTGRGTGRSNRRRPAGSSSATPISGSRNGRLSCTGPAHRVGSRRPGASDRQRRPLRRRSATPGSCEPAHRAGRRGRSGRWSAARRRRAAPAAGRPSARASAPPTDPASTTAGMEVGRRRAARAQQQRGRRRRARARGRRTPATRSSWTTCTCEVRRDRRAPAPSAC